MIIPYIIESYNQNNHVIRYYDGDEKVTIFQSYKTTMFTIRSNPTCIIVNENESNYTNTTCKYLYKFLEDFVVYDSDYSPKLRQDIHKILQSNNKKRSLLEYIVDINGMLYEW